jgi:hypothetical protein
MHDPFQSYQPFGPYTAAASPFGLPYGGPQPQYGVGSQLSNPAIGAYGIPPQLQQLQQLQHLQMLQQLQQGQGQQFPQGLGGNPMGGLYNPLLQHPLAATLLQHQLNSQWNPMAAYQNWPQQQQFGYPLAPQSLIGGGSPYGGNPLAGNPGIGGIHPLAAQLALRSLSGGGISPFGY